MTVDVTSDLPVRITAFLEQQGLAGQQLTALARDASSRQYYRLADQSLLLMDDHLDPRGFAAFLELSAHLAARGLSAPQVRAADRAQGLALVEDFGTGTYANCLAAGHDESALYALAVDALLHLHHQPMAGTPDCLKYDLGILLDELDVFSDWYAPRVAGEAFDAAGFAAQFRALWTAALAPVATRFEMLVLRDFHVDNLMLLPERQGVARCGLLDFQDAVIGPCEYDLVSLLQDARRDLTPGLEQAMLARYIASAPAYLGGEDAIRQRYALLGAQRHARILGTFVRLNERDGKAQYLQYMPRVAGQLEQALADAGLTDIVALMDAHLPDWRRRGAAMGA